MHRPSSETASSSPAAGELADVVAHGLSAIAIQAEAAEAVLRNDPAQAAVPLATIRASALEALADMRLLLAVLRDTDGGCARMPQPGLDQLPALVERARAAGDPVTLEVHTTRALPASLQLAIYRIAQEALATAREAAPGARTTIRVDAAAGPIEVTVVDTGGGARDLARLEDRVRLHGGRLEAGPAPGGGYAVRAIFG